MKITIENEGITATVEQDAVTIWDALELVRCCLLAVGFHPKTIEREFGGPK